MSREPESYRPSLVTLSRDAQRLFAELVNGGLSDRDRILTWLQQITIRTLGTVSERVYADVSRQFRVEGILLASLVCRSARRRSDVSDQRASKLRERLVVNELQPAHNSAFKSLRKNATEYVDSGTDSAHSPENQSHVAMRPALSELDEWQEKTLSRFLSGFDSRSDIIDWGSDLLLATHGEIEKEWIKRLYEENPDILIGENPSEKRGRRLFAAYYILPEFRSGVRVLSDRAGEIPDESKQNERSVEFA